MTRTLPPVDTAVADDGPKPRRRLSNRTLLAIAGGIAAGGALLVWVIAFSPLLGVSSVVVHGEQRLSVGFIEAKAQVPHGRPLVRVDVAAIQHRVEAIGQVESARVSVSFPQTVVITVVERQPIGFVITDGRYALVDRTGTQYLAVPARPAHLPLFAVPAGPKAQATGAAIATVAASLDPALLGKIASIQAFDPNSVTLVLTDQRVVHWGSADRSAEKARILSALLGQPGTQIDVSNPDVAYTH
jgi:cell division protein FtsQ